MYTTGHMLRDEVIALHAFAAQCHGVQTMRVFNVYPNSKYTVVWGPRRYHIFPKTDIWALGALKGPPASTFGPLGPLRAHLVGPLGPLRAHLVGPLGPLRAHTPPEPEPEPDEVSIPNQAPLPSRPGTKYVAQGTLAATKWDANRDPELDPTWYPKGPQS